MEGNALQTVERSIQVLELLATRPYSQAELAKVMELNKSTLFRLVKTLEMYKLVERDELTGLYRVGIKLVELASLRLNQIELKTEAAPILREASMKLQQVVHMAVLKEGQVVYIEKIEPLNHIRMFSQIGRTMPVHCTALGKSLLVQHTKQQVLDILALRGMERRTDHTLDSSDALWQQIQSGRINGFTLDNEENEPGIYCVAAPIFDYRGNVVAAISTSGDHRDFIEHDDDLCVQVIRSCANEISSRLGYTNSK